MPSGPDIAPNQEGVLRTRWKLWLGVLLADAAFFITAFVADLPFEAAATAAITTLCATWWVLEPISIAATSLIPFAALPLLGISTHEEVASAYGHTLILLLLGGFILSTAVEKSGAHKRIALGMVRLTPSGGKSSVLGFMLASAFCSMWISNTATTLMLLPVALAYISDCEDKSIRTPLLLGIAYAASIGGLATPVGTPPNVIFMGVFERETGIEFSFLDWMLIGAPVTAVMIPIAWLHLTRKLGPMNPPKVPPLGPWRPAEVRVLTIFAITAAAWVFRAAPFGGWTGLFDLTGVSDSTVAMAAVVVLFITPSGEKDGGRLLDWETAAAIPWGLLILFGGGIALAGAFKTSGLSPAIGDALAALTSWPLVLMIGTLAFCVTFLTEVTSNTATTNLLMPILAAAAIGAGVIPEQLMIPAALSASCAFMLPVATAPNAIMFGTGHISTRQMAREGFALNIYGALVITAVCSLLL